MTTERSPKISALWRVGRRAVGRSSASDLLRLADFRYYLASNTFGNIGFQLRTVATFWLVLELTDSSFWVGFVPFVAAIPAVALTLFGGAVADRADRRTVIITGRLSQSLLAFLVAYAIAADSIQLWHLLLVAVAQSTIVAFQGPAWMSIFVDVVGRHRLVVGNALSFGAADAAEIAGAALAGYLIASYGLAYPFYLAAVTHLVSFALLLKTRRRSPRQSKPVGSIVSYVLDGIGYVVREPGIPAALLVLFSGVFGAAIFALMPVYARDVLTAGPGGYGTLAAAFGAGSLAGSIVLSFSVEITKKAMGVIVAAAIWDVSMIAFAFSSTFLLSVALVFLMGVVGIVWLNLVLTILQLLSKEEMRGRVMSLHTMGLQLMPLGMMFGGALAATIGNELALVASAALGTPVMAVVYARSATLRRM